MPRLSSAHKASRENVKKASAALLKKRKQAKAEKAAKKEKEERNANNVLGSSTRLPRAKKTTPSSPYELAISEECRAHLAQQWAALGAEWFIRFADVQQELDFNFRNDDIFTYPEVEALVSAVQKWVVSAVYEKFGIERFSPLLEMHLISKHILPDVCAYVLSKEHECSPQEAENIYGQKRAALALPSSPPIMEGGSNTKQQKGGGNNDDGRSGNNGNGKKE